MLTSEMIVQAWNDEDYRVALIEQGYAVPDPPQDPEAMSLSLDRVLTHSATPRTSSCTHAVTPRGSSSCHVVTPRPCS